MDIIISFLLLITAVALLFKRPVKIEVTHKHIVETQEIPNNVKDPNLIDPKDPEMEKTINNVIQSINAIMNGGEFPDGERQ